ncbi:hypothetical protein BDN72DRAFT_864426 [Pluteus cervinus]|uniref:Uncharacterized protein n=1 Tax=Pluteus cervinus TaxID=181527 RepID=A0ACD3A3W2_9AGAR|nr:hypothetical protein BDN72DRAFT_864426 [Pluteus cervinus]
MCSYAALDELEFGKWRRDRDRKEGRDMVYGGFVVDFGGSQRDCHVLWLFVTAPANFVRTGSFVCCNAVGVCGKTYQVLVICLDLPSEPNNFALANSSGSLARALLELWFFKAKEEPDQSHQSRPRGLRHLHHISKRTKSLCPSQRRLKEREEVEGGWSSWGSGSGFKTVDWPLKESRRQMQRFGLKNMTASHLDFVYRPLGSSTLPISPVTASPAIALLPFTRTHYTSHRDAQHDELETIFILGPQQVKLRSFIGGGERVEGRQSGGSGQFVTGCGRLGQAEDAMHAASSLIHEPRLWDVKHILLAVARLITSSGLTSTFTVSSFVSTFGGSSDATLQPIIDTVLARQRHGPRPNPKAVLHLEFNRNWNIWISTGAIMRLWLKLLPTNPGPAWTIHWLFQNTTLSICSILILLNITIYILHYSSRYSYYQPIDLNQTCGLLGEVESASEEFRTGPFNLFHKS